MIARQVHLRPALIALAAMAMMLSVGGDASACSAMKTGQAKGGCCAGRDAGACCCEAVASESRPTAADRAMGHLMAHDGRSIPNSRCECRSGGPTQPAPKPRTSTSERRIDHDRVSSLELTLGAGSAVTSMRPVPLAERPPAAPIYLRTSRLLI
jgi:hypothetical protein